MAIGIASSWFEKAFSAKNGSVSSETNESIMDFSESGGLCADVWERGDGGKFSLREDVRKKLTAAAEWAIEKYSLKEPIVRIIGSICSNAFDGSTDIDIHITDTSLDLAKRDKMNEEMRNDYKNELDKDDRYVGEHPIELYIQENEFRDLLSVGCYDLVNEKWEEGPMLYKDGYDPYALYFDSIYSAHSTLIEEVRDTVMRSVELGYAIMLANGDTSEQFEDKISEIISDSRTCLENCRNMRGALTEPKSKEEAERIRVSEDWKVADATFKLLGKYGYVPFVKKVSEIDKGVSKEEFSDKVVELAGKKLFIKKDS